MTSATPFLLGHATHPHWAMALGLAGAQIEAQRMDRGPTAPPLTLGLCYFSDHYAAHAQDLYFDLRQRWPEVRWAGCASVAIAATGVEYVDEPALVLMLCDLPAGSFQIFSGTQPMGGQAFTALVHADPQTPDLPELIQELAQRTQAGHVFGGLLWSREGQPQLAQGVCQGGLSGVAFGAEVGLISRVTQGCQPVAGEHVVTAAEGSVVLTLDHEPALSVLLDDLGVADQDPRRALPLLRQTLAGLSDAGTELLARGKQFGEAVRVRHLVGLDPLRHGVAVAERMQPGMRLAFSRRDREAAQRDLVRICSEIREELDGDDTQPPRPARGAVYVSCSGRGGHHFGAPSAELKIIQRALGEVPLVGFFAAGEIAHQQLYGYTGVLTVFT